MLTQVRFQQFTAGTVTQPTNCLLLDLTNTLTGQAEFLTDLLERHLRTTDTEEVFDDITTGASQDIKQATGLAKSMVTKFGMSEAVGLINYDDDNNEVFIGRDLAHTARGYGEGVATVIDQEVKRIIDECYDRARHIIRKYDDVLHTCADLLLEKEKISREEFEALFPEDVSED